MTEQQEQQALFKWSQQPYIRAKYPCLKLLHHIPNERKCTPIQGRQLKLAGVRAGVPDITLPVARGPYHALFIEMKSETGRTSPEQEWWIEELNAAGNFAEVCHGWESAVRVIEWYLALPKEEKIICKTEICTGAAGWITGSGRRGMLHMIQILAKKRILLCGLVATAPAVQIVVLLLWSFTKLTPPRSVSVRAYAIKAER